MDHLNLDAQNTDPRAAAIASFKQDPRWFTDTVNFAKHWPLELEKFSGGQNHSATAWPFACWLSGVTLGCGHTSHPETCWDVTLVLGLQGLRCALGFSQACQGAPTVPSHSPLSRKWSGPVGSLTLLEKFPGELRVFLRSDQTVPFQVIFGQGWGCTFQKGGKASIWCLWQMSLSRKEMTNLRTLEV